MTLTATPAASAAVRAAETRVSASAVVSGVTAVVLVVVLMVALLLGGSGGQWWTGTGVGDGALTAVGASAVRRSRAADQNARSRAAAASSAPTQFGAV